MCYGLDIALHLIAWTLYSVTTQFMLTFYGSADYEEASYVSSFRFVVVYLVVGGMTKTLILLAVLIASFESQEYQLSKDI